MKILIVGSKGFIGSFLYNYFSTNHDCWSADVVSDYSNSKHFIIDESSSDFEELFELNQFDICVNCSGAASVPDSLVHPGRDFTLNTFNVFKILNAIRKFNACCKFINLSSAAVYGNPIRLPVKESDEPKPISPYGHHKLMAENICIEFSKIYDIKTCSIRIFSAYGDGLKKQLFFDLFKKISTSSKVELSGTGEETRDFIHIEDIAQIVEMVLFKAKFLGETINVANSIEVSIRQVVYLFTTILNWKGELIFNGELRQGDPLRWQADTSTILSFGYHQSVTLESGLHKYIQWANENI